MKSIHKKNIKNNYLYQLQEFIIFYNYKTVKSIINRIVLAFRIIQIYKISYFKDRK